MHSWVSGILCCTEPQSADTLVCGGPLGLHQSHRLWRHAVLTHGLRKSCHYLDLVQAGMDIVYMAQCAAKLY